VKVGVIKSCDHRRRRRFEVGGTKTGAKHQNEFFFKLPQFLRTGITNLPP